MEPFQTIWKLSGTSENFPNRLETFHIAWKLSTPSGNFSDCPVLSRLSGNFPHCLEKFQTVLKLSTHSGKFPHLYSLSLMFELHFMGNFVNTSKNFPDAQ